MALVRTVRRFRTVAFPAQGRKSLENAPWMKYATINRLISSSSLSSKSEDLPSSSSSVFWCGQVVFPQQVRQGTVEVANGKIINTTPGQSKSEAEQMALQRNANFVDLGENSCLSPGLVDVHVHISALGRDWEGYMTASKAAAAGGITTIIGMPLNSLPPTICAENFALEQEAAGESQLFVDVGLWGGVVSQNCNAEDLDNLLSSGVLGLKAFLAPLPPAAGYEAISPEQLLEASKICGRHNKPILVHSELMTADQVQQYSQESFDRWGNQSQQAHLNCRPPEWEQKAVEVVCQAASFCAMHVVHLSNALCLERIRLTKQDPSKELTVETCPHYLMLDSEMMEDGDTRVKCFPPIRDPANRENLWQGMASGLIDMVASDHSPCETSMRCRESGNMKDAWGGLTGLQYQLQATWREASKRNFTPLDMARWWSSNPCAMANLSTMKGSIEPGKQADLCWWDPDHMGAPNDYCQEYHRWAGDTVFASDPNMRGRVLGTWVNGVKVYDGLSDQHLDIAGSFIVDSSEVGSLSEKGSASFVG